MSASGKLTALAAAAAWAAMAQVAPPPPAATSTASAPATRPAGAPRTATAATASRAATPTGDPSALLDASTGRPVLPNVLRYLDDLFRSDSSVSRVKLVVTKPRRRRTTEMRIWTRGRERALLVVQAPRRDAGTATLKVGDNLWNYLPRISRTIRIPPSMMLSAWMGSDFTNDDLVRRSSLVDDFDSSLIGRSDDPAGWLIELRARPGVVGLWEKIEYVMTADAALPVRARYYDRKGRLARTMTFQAVKTFDGRRIPSHLVLTPADKQGHRTELFYLEVDFDADVPESTFSLSRLEQHR